MEELGPQLSQVSVLHVSLHLAEPPRPGAGRGRTENATLKMKRLPGFQDEDVPLSHVLCVPEGAPGGTLRVRGQLGPESSCALGSLWSSGHCCPSSPSTSGSRPDAPGPGDSVAPNPSVPPPPRGTDGAMRLLPKPQRGTPASPFQDFISLHGNPLGYFPLSPPFRVGGSEAPRSQSWQVAEPEETQPDGQSTSAPSHARLGGRDVQEPQPCASLWDRRVPLLRTSATVVVGGSTLGASDVHLALGSPWGYPGMTRAAGPERGRRGGKALLRLRSLSGDIRGTRSALQVITETHACPGCQRGHVGACSSRAAERALKCVTPAGQSALHV